ncbi:MAG: DUF502 domain-containing protein [Candidatus Omnitrophota bacterium]
MVVKLLKKYFISGLAVFVPLALALYVFVWVMNFAEGLLGKYLKPFFIENYDFYFWGMGIIILVAVILLCGFFIANYFGKMIHRAAERIVLRIPLLGSIYPAFKEIASFMFTEHSRNIQQVVMVEWPCKGMYMIAFLTNKTTDRIAVKIGRKMSNVMIPHVPNPLVGFVVMVPDEDIVPLPLTIEEAVKIIVSGGVINGDEICNRESPDGPSAA